MELNIEDTLSLISELKLMGEYDYIILDTDFSIDRESLKIYRQAQAIVMVGDGSVESNTKTERAHTALSIMEANSDAPLTNRMVYIYDKVSSKSAQSINAPGLKVLGGAPKYSGASTRQIAEKLAAMEIFDEIL